MATGKKLGTEYWVLNMSITRRIFLKNGALAIAATTAVPGFLARAALGAEASGRKRFLVAMCS